MAGIAKGDRIPMSKNESWDDSVKNNPMLCMDVSVTLPIDQPTLLLDTDEIQVWLMNLRQPMERLQALTATLTTDEQERAARFHGLEQQHRFIAGRGLLRELLGAYLGRPAAALRFSPGQHGKPALSGVDAGAGLHFNLSHSADRALYAVACRELGVDLECKDRRVSHTAVAERICTPREWAAFQALPTECLHEAFFACWTRKEAIAKALGDGLSSDLRTLEVCFPENESSDSRTTVRDRHGREWSVLSLPLEPGWHGALAAAGIDWHWRDGRWT